MDVAEAELAEAANRLYWSSSGSVNRIADDLGLSKGTLYGLIEPIGADRACSECGGDLTFANRTAREKGVARCLACGVDEAGHARTVPVEAAWPGPLAKETPEPSVGSSVTNGRVLAGTVLLGIAAGILIVRLTRRR